MGRPDKLPPEAEPEPDGTAADDVAAATGRGGLRRRLPPRYWRYPAAAVALLAVAAVNFALGQRTATDSLRAAADHPTGAGVHGPQVRYGFETAVAPWAPAWNAPNLTATADPAVADTGRRSLRLQAAPDAAAPPAIGTADVPGLGPGGTVTFRIRYLAGSGQVRPYVQDTDGNIHWPAMTPPQLQPQGWTTCSWRVPPVAVRSVGLELDSAGTAGLVVALDTVEW